MNGILDSIKLIRACSIEINPIDYVVRNPSQSSINKNEISILALM